MADFAHIDKVIWSDKVLPAGEERLMPAAIAISGSKICAVGELSDMRQLSMETNGSNCHAEFINYEGACIYPGFHDAHMHVFHSALYSSSLAASFLGENEQDCVRRMQEFSLARKSGWLLAQGWREYRWDIPKKPTKASLDEVFPTRPVALYSGDAHTLWLNSAALRELGINSASEPPAGGYYERTAKGELTGIVGETAAMELMPKIVSTFSDHEVMGAYRGFLNGLAEAGVTAVCDMSLMPGQGMDFIKDDIYDMLLASANLTTRISMFPTLQEDLARFEHIVAAERDPMLRACGLKQFFDGVSSQHTAWLHDDYSNAAYPADCGRPSVEPQHMRSLVLNANSKGYPVRIHAIGDEAIHVALDIFEESRNKFGPLPNGAKNCIEHLENFQPADIGRLGALGVVASVQPAHMTLDPGGPERDLGADRVPYMWPFASLLKTGARLAFGTDSPVVPANPLDTIYTALTRTEAHTHEPEGGWLPSERISRIQAIRAYTTGSAHAAQRSYELGEIREGAFADIVVLNSDLLTCSDDEIQQSEVLATYVGGTPVFER